MRNALSAFCFIALIFCSVATPAAGQEKVRIGLSSISATSGSLWVAEEKGLFKKHGIDVEVIVIGGGAARVTRAWCAKSKPAASSNDCTKRSIVEPGVLE